jgi:uncharacterized protein (TIGR03437 family)
MSMALGAIAALPSYGQPIFSARDFLLTLQFKPGLDIEPSGAPMALHPKGIYVAGAFQSTGLDFQAFLRRYDPSGNEMWTRQVPAPGIVIPSGLAVDATGVYLAGSIGFGRTDLFIRKYDEGGTEVWSRQIRISDGGYHLLAGMAADSSGLYVAAWDGRTVGLVTKYSTSGDEQWSRTLTVRSLRGLAVDAGLYVAGTNDQGGFVSKHSLGGDSLWTRQLGSTESEAVLPAGLATDSGGLYVGGSTFRMAGTGGSFLPETEQAFLRKLDGNGNEVWARRISAPNSVSVVSVAADSAAIYVSGATRTSLPGQCKAGDGDVFVRRYDATGVEQWTRQFGTAGYDFAGSLAVDSTGVYLSGGIRGGAQHGSLFVAKLDKTQVIANQPRPQISWECVVNAASYSGGGVAPGEIVSIFGRAIGPAELTPLQLAADGHVATTLAGTRVLFNGVPAPLLYVSATQSSAIVPYEVADKPTVVVETEYRGVRSDPLTLPVASSRPGIFSLNGSGSGQGAILNEDGTLNSPDNPAARGSIIVLYVTGEGLTDPSGVDGAILGVVVPKPKLPVSVGFDDDRDGGGYYSPAEVLYAGGVSGAVSGLLQVNLRVPSWARVGNAVSIYLQIGPGDAETGITVALH